MVDTKRLIIVEDELLIADMLQMMVEELGWSVAGIAISAEEGRELLDAHEPAVAILDVSLGNSTTSAGIACACHRRNIPIIYITGYSAGYGPEGPFVAVLTKPFTSAEIAEALAAAAAACNALG